MHGGAWDAACGIGNEPAVVEAFGVEVVFGEEPGFCIGEPDFDPVVVAGFGGPHGGSGDACGESDGA